MKIIVVIPARYGSIRFPGKVLAKDTGKYLLQHTWEQAMQARCAEQVLIATDSSAVMLACGEFGATCVMTRQDHQSGTDRIAEAVEGIECDIVVNLQADEPEIDPDHIDLTAGLLVENSQADMATLLAPFDNAEQIANPNIVKCITDSSSKAIYFSRSVIPYNRDRGGIGPVEIYRRHLGIYAYRKFFLKAFTGLSPGFLEHQEKLEQLRAIENGHMIQTAMVDKAWDGIDTLQQYREFVQRRKDASIEENL